MNPFYILGTGPGGKDNLTLKACEIVAASDVIIGSERAVASVASIIHSRPIKPEIVFLHKNRDEIINYLKDRNSSKKYTLLVTGDAGFYSLQTYVSLHFAKEEYRVYPGISSIQLAAARLGLMWHEAYFYSVHGRDMDTSISELARAFIKGKPIYILTDSKRDPVWLAETLKQKKFPVMEMVITLFYNLGYDNEAIIHTDYPGVETGVMNRKDGLCLVLIRKK
jgi:cobalt-precorrin-7 (C5)-methyltransferase